MQVAPEQQPEQFVELQEEMGEHLPDEQLSPFEQAAQVIPLSPQPWFVCIEGATQTPERQQPLGQLDALHPTLTQEPF